MTDTKANMITNPKAFLRDLFDRAVEVADPMRSLGTFLPRRPKGRLIVIGAGKASARMAEAVESAWGPCDGLVITRYGHGRPTQGIKIAQASHPVPDQAGLDATARLLDMVTDLSADDFVLMLISGGASALLTAPSDGVSLAQKQAVTTALLASGAPIDQINTVRKHLSRVKGGQLAARVWPARMLTLMISDVPGDDPAHIGSGPTVGCASTPQDARAILARWGVPVPPGVETALELSSAVIPPDDPRLSRVENVIYAAPTQSLIAAGERAMSAGAIVHPLADGIEGEARDVARAQADIALNLQRQLQPGDPPALLLSGGELTVTRRGTGIGGPNAEFCLALALALDGAPGIHAIACDTDGVDGAAEVAGAIIGPDTLSRAAALGIDPQGALANNDAHGFFGLIGDQVITGPTLTNVNDFRAILLFPTKAQTEAHRSLV